MKMRVNIETVIMAMVISFILGFLLMSTGCDGTLGAIYDDSETHQTGSFTETRGDGNVYRINLDGTTDGIGTPTPEPLEESP